MNALAWVVVLILSAFLLLFSLWGFFRAEYVPLDKLKKAFLTGTFIFSAFFLFFTYHTFKVLPERTQEDALDAEVVKGKRTWQKYNCIDCHTILGNGAYFAPDLTKAWDRFLERAGGDEKAAEISMANFLKNPPKPSGRRRGMPNLGVSDEEAHALVKFFKWVSSIDTNNWPPEPAIKLFTGEEVKKKLASAVEKGSEEMEGKKLFVSRGCTSCHTIGQGPLVGPDLTIAYKNLKREDIIMLLTDAEKFYQARGNKPVNEGFSKMPDMGLSREEAEKIADYLAQVK